MPSQSWKDESITSIKAKLSFIFNTFIVPYLEEDEQLRAMTSLGIRANTLNTKGIVRFRYALTTGQTITTEANMNSIFEGTGSGLPVESKRVMSTVYEDDSNGTNRYAYEYVGFINIPEEAEYVFGINSDDASDVYVDRERVAYWYTTGSHDYKSPENTTGGSVTTPAKRFEPGQYPIRVRYVRSLTSGNTRFNLLWKKSTDSQFETIPCENLFHDPSIMSTNVSMVDSVFDENNIVDNVLDFDRFGLYFGTPSNDMLNAIKTNLASIKISNNNAVYNPFNTGSSTIPTLSPTTPNVVTGDVNFDNYLNTLRSVSNGNKLQTLLSFVQSIRFLYNIMSEEVLENIKAGNSVSVPGYNIDPATYRTILYNTTTIDTEFPGLVDVLNKFTRVEHFVFRRMLLLMDLIIHSHICMFMFKTVYPDTSYAAAKNKISDMIVFFIQRIKLLNNNFGMMFENRAGNTSNSLVKNLYDNVREFNKNTENINELDRQVKESKNALKTRNNLLKNQKQLYDSGTKWTLFAMIVTIIIVVTLLSYAVMARLNPSLKWVGAGSVALFASIVALTIYFIKTKKMETFVGGGIYQEQVLSDILTTGTALATITSAYYVDTMKEMDSFIQNTINMALILQNNNAYKYINYNLQKETSYYNGTKMQIDNATASVGASERMYNLNTRNNLSKINTFIALIIILTFGVVGYVVTDGYVTLQYIVLTVTSLLLLIVAILYIMDTQRKVRTDGAKIYWGQPTETLQKLK
jgi:hypothetical protein